MDFSSFVDTERASGGSWLHLSHPASGLPLYLQKDGTVGTDETDRPCEVLVRGNRAPEVRAITRERERAEELHAAKLMRAQPAEAARLMAQDSAARDRYQRDLLVATVGDWRNIVIKAKDGPAECTSENVLAALSHPLMMVQIFRRSGDEAALFTSAPTG